jgi:hypothetical protein
MRKTTRAKVTSDAFNLIKISQHSSCFVTFSCRYWIRTRDAARLSVYVMKVGDHLVDQNGEVDRALDPTVVESLAGRDPEHVAALCAETLDDGNSVLVFCGSKKVGTVGTR